MRRELHIKIIILLTAVCIALYFLSLPVLWEKYDSPTGKKAVMWCPQTGGLVKTFAWEGMETNYTTLFKGKQQPDPHMKRDLHLVDVARFSCRKCDAQKTEYYYGVKTVFSATSALKREMCLPAEHDWEVVTERKSSEEEVHNIFWPGMLIRPYAPAGILFMLLFFGAVVSTLKRFKENEKVTLRYILRRIIPLIVLGSLTVALGFAGIVSTTIRLVEIYRDSEYGPSARELRFSALDSNWPILGMALFTIIVTAIVILVFNYLRNSQDQAAI